MNNMVRPSLIKSVPLCDEICILLDKPDKIVQIDESHSFERKITDIFIDALVNYGKPREKILQISKMSVQLCHYIGIGKTYCNVFKTASLIYDIGNLNIDVNIYNKDMKLSFEEFEIIKHHTVIGHDALRAQANPTLDMAALVSLQHHEWYDGSGYPHRLKGNQISIGARIIALTDTVVALYRDRPGREKMSFEEIVMHIKKRKNLQFDPDVVEQFLEHEEEMKGILKSHYSI